MSNEITQQKNIENMEKEFKQKEEIFFRILIDNGAIDMDHLQEQANNNQNADMVREYLKSIGNELSDKPIQERPKTSNNSKKNVVSKKETPLQLQRRVAELERKAKEDLKRQETMQQKLMKSN